MTNWKYNPKRRLFLKNLGIVTAGLPFLGIGRKAYAMLANRMMTGAAGANIMLLQLECNATELASWYSDYGSGAACTAETNAPGGDPKATVWYYNTGASTARRYDKYTTLGSVEALGDTVYITVQIYCDAIGAQADSDDFRLVLQRSDMEIIISFASDGLFVYDGAAYNEVGTNLVVQDTWQKWMLKCKNLNTPASAVLDVYLNDSLEASNVDCSYTGSFSTGYCKLSQFGYATANQISYLDYVTIGNNPT